MSGTRLSLLALLVALGGFAVLAGAGPDDDAGDPVAIQRLEVTPEKLAEELKQHKGVFVELPRKTFEDKVRAAAEAQRDSRNPPSIVEAHYRAVFDPTGLSGTAQWKVVSTAANPTVLPLQALNLALANPRIDNANARVADFDGKAPGLLVEKKGEHQVTMDWTSRVEARPGGYQLEIETPRTPICDLELYLPRDHEIGEATDGCLITGPHPSDRAEHFLWRVVFSQVSPLHLVVRRASDPASPQPLVESQLHTTVDIEPDMIDVAFEFDFKVLHRGVRQLRVAVDGSLDVNSVTLAGMESYRIEPATLAGPPPSGAPQGIVVQLRDELRAGKLQIVCRARLPFSGTGRIESWTAPGAAISGDAVQAESLIVRASPEVAVENWQSGSYVLTRISATKEGGQQFVLAGGLRDSIAVPRAPGSRPGARLVRASADYCVRQQTLWQIGPQGSSIVSRVSIDLNHGRLQQVPLQVPADWEVDQVEASPGDMLSHWRVVPEGNAPVLYVMFKRLLSAPVASTDGDPTKVNESSAQLTVRLRPATRVKREPAPPAAFAVAVPDLVPVKARAREGGFAVEYDRTLLDVRLTPAPAMTGGDRSIPPADEDCPWGKNLPGIYLPFRGEPYRGSVTVIPRGRQLRASSSSTVFLNAAARQLVVQARLQLHLDLGKTDTVDVTLSAPLPDEAQVRDWRTEDARLRIESVERLTEHADRWRIHFAQPLTAAQPVTVTCALVTALPAESCDIPLPTVEGAATVEGDVRIFLSGVNIGSMENDDLAEQSSNTRGVQSGPSPWRTFRYTGGSPRLSLRGLVAAMGRSADAGAENVSVNSYVESGQIRHHYRFTIWSTHPQSIPVGLTLPPGAKLEAIAIDGRWSTDLPVLVDDDSELSLPMPPVVPPRQAEGSSQGAGMNSAPETTASHAYEIVYVTETARIGLWGTLTAPEPQLSLRATHCRRTWCLPPGMQPLGTHGYQQSLADVDRWSAWQATSTGDRPPLLVVRTGGVAFAGMALALLLSLAFLVALSRSRPAVDSVRGRLPVFVLAAWIAAAGIAAIWLPRSLTVFAAWPFAAGCLLALGWYASFLLWGQRGATFHRARPTVVGSSVSAGLVVIGAAILLATLSACGMEQISSEPHSPATVYLVNDGKGSTAKEAVVAPQELLTRLDEMAHAVPLGLQGAVLESADYNGYVQAGETRFRAVFKAQCFRDDDKPATLTIPLSGVELDDDEILLDGARVSPIAVGRPPTAWQFLVKGRGLHTVDMRFTVPVHRDRDDEDVEFQIPPLLQSQLTFVAPPCAQYLLARGTKAPARGRQLTDYPGPCACAARILGSAPSGGLAVALALGVPSSQAPVLHADLGRLVSPLRLRWHLVADLPVPGVRAPDIRLKESYLWSLRPTGASLSASLQYDVREGSLTELMFELPPTLSIEAIEATISDRLPVRLRDWHVRETHGVRILQVELMRPIHGMIEIDIRLVRSAAPGGVLDLSVLNPILPATLVNTDTAKPDRLLAYEVEGMDPRLLELRQAARVDSAKFDGFAGGSAKGSTTAQPPRDVFSFRRRSNDLTVARVQLEPAVADVTASQEITWRIASDFADLRASCKLEPKAGDVPIAEWEVPPGVVITHVGGNDVHSWSRTGNRLQVCLAPPGDDHAHSGATTIVISGWQKHETGQTVRFNLPNLRLIGVRAQQSTLHVIPGAGLALERIGSWPAPVRLPRPDQPEWEYHYQQNPPKGSFSVRPLADLDVRTLSFVEVNGDKILWNAIVDCESRHGDLHNLGVRLAHWTGGDVQIDAPHVHDRRDRPQFGKTAWSLEFEPGVKGHYRFSLTGSIPLDATTQGLALPEVTVDEADPEHAQHWLAVDAALTPDTTAGMVSQGVADVEIAWPAEKTRIAAGKWAMWRSDRSDWTVTFSPGSTQAPDRSIRLVLAEHVAAVLDGASWTHQATYWIGHDHSADLTFDLPGGARVVGLWVNGHPTTPLQASPDRLWVPVAGGGSASRVDIRWQLSDGSETLVMPNAHLPRLDGADAPVLWTVYVPTGCHASAEDTPDHASSPNTPPSLRPVDGDAVRQARKRALQELSDSAAGLSTMDLLSLVDPSAPGTPLFWRGQSLEQVPELHFMSQRERDRRIAILLSLALVASVAMALLIRRQRRLHVWLQRTWPEQLILVAAAAWMIGVPVVPWLFLVGVAARLLLLNRRRRAASGAPADDTPAMPSSSVV